MNMSTDRSDKFLASNKIWITSSCQTCIHRSHVLPSACVAFPDGIPMPILTGENDHTKPYEGDHGILYEAE